MSSDGTNEKHIFNNKLSIRKKERIHVSLCFFSSPSIQKNRKLLGKKFQGSRLDVDSCYTKCGSRSPGKLRSQAWVFCCVPHGFFPWPTFVERRFTSKKHPKKSKWIQNVILKWFKNVIFQNSFLEVCSFEFKPSSEIVVKCLRISVRSALFELARSAGRAHRSWRRIGIFNLTPAESLVLWKQRWTFGSKQAQKKRWRLKTHGAFFRGWVGDSFFNSETTGETRFKLQSEEF